MRRFRAFYIVICIILILSSLLSGCEEPSDDGRNDEIELKAPVGVVEDYEIVSARDMYQVDVYSSSVNPVVTEYSFSKEQTFKKYGAIPGDTVENGDVLVYSETKSIEKQTEDIEVEIEDLEANHTIEMERLEKSLKEAKKNEEEKYEAYYKIAREEPDPCTIQHDMWEEQVHWPEFSYKNAVQNRERVEEDHKEKTELYELEHAYLLEKKQMISDKVVDTTVVSKSGGEIVAVNYFSNGDSVGKDIPVVAVGDTSVKVMRTEYIAKGTIAKALDVYAIIDGKRYELEYQNMEPEEYKQLTDAGETVYSMFLLVDEENQVNIGSYGVVVVENDRRRDVLCVSNDALNKENDGYYVYLYDESQTTYVPVETGMKDALYTEVISGLSSGDKVLTNNSPKIGKNTARITRGDYAINTEISGFLFYPFSEWMVNPAQNGTTYLKEFLVAENETVTEGQSLATIEVVSDQIEIERLSSQINRMQARLDEMILIQTASAAKDVVSLDLNIKISETERDIRIKRRELNKLSKYAGIIEIKAPYDGVVTQLSDIKPGDILQPDANIVEIANESTRFIIVKDDKNQLSYGNYAQITASGTSGPVTIEGRVVTVNNMCLSSKMASEYSLIAVSKEDMEKLSGSVMIDPGRWDRNNFKVSVKVRSEKSVLMVPKPAVTAKDKSTYVTVVNNDGSVERKSFIPGGSDNNYYWIVDGLSEGTTVCWE